MSVRKADVLCMLTCIKVCRSGLSMMQVQYDDALFIGKATMENLWAIKTILKCFELALGLRVNFAKSCIMRINVDVSFLRLAANFLHRSIGSFPFKYLGLPIGANSRRLSTWRSLFDTLVTRLVE
jgi:hypothetical protein